MGRGNTCVFGKYEGLYYVDRDYLDEYYNKANPEEYKYRSDISYSEFDEWEYDDIQSEINYDDFVCNLICDLKQKFKSLQEISDKRFGDILENRLFTITIEDNEWSYAVKLIQKEQDYYDKGNLEGLQKQHYQNYLNGIKECLFNQFEELGTYAGAWLHGTIRKE